MCSTWTQKQWQDAANKTGTYSVIGTFQNAEGRTAIQVKELGGSFTDLYWNVYSEDGIDANVYTSPGEANKRMEARGFTPVEQTTTAAIAEAAERDAGRQVRVQGRTFEEWAQVGRDNESRADKDRIHPYHPRNHGEDRAATEDEMKAFELSLPPDEREFLGMLTLLSAL